MRELVDACFSGIYLHSHEHEDAISELALLCSVEQWSLSTWDIDRGLSPPIADAEDPLAAIHAFRNREGEGTSILVLQNFHRFLQSAEIVQAIHHAVVAGKTTRNILVILSPVVQLPVELATLFVTVEHARPNRRQLLEIARGVVSCFEWIYEQATRLAIGPIQQLTESRPNSASPRRIGRGIQPHHNPFSLRTKENNVTSFYRLLVPIARFDGCVAARVAASSASPWTTRNRAPSDPKEVLSCRPNPAVGRRRL
ncbi:AAA ATPase central domain protein [Rhodopirellula europaea 6C]|uniref:AAA ATPase central domain protein n=2 Tax=Rhodopirellula TaxID=265488 RepID=M2AG35_9BACT|nr:AAA ATPase central domain protein [Rhodopirellula europaea 6C]